MITVTDRTWESRRRPIAFSAARPAIRRPCLRGVSINAEHAVQQCVVSLKARLCSFRVNVSSRK